MKKIFLIKKIVPLTIALSISFIGMANLTQASSFQVPVNEAHLLEDNTVTYSLNKDSNGMQKISVHWDVGQETGYGIKIISVDRAVTSKGNMDGIVVKYKKIYPTLENIEQKLNVETSEMIDVPLATLPVKSVSLIDIDSFIDQKTDDRPIALKSTGFLDTLKQEPAIFSERDVTYKLSNDSIVLSWEQKNNAEYRIQIVSVIQKEDELIVNYIKKIPESNNQYPFIITTPTDTAKLPKIDMPIHKVTLVNNNN